MQIVINIPNSEIPKQQNIIEIPLHFIDGKVCEAGGYGFDVLPKGHGDLVDRDELLVDSYCIDDWSGNEVNIVDVMTIKMADTIIESNKEQEDCDIFDDIMNDESDGEVYEKIKEIIDKVKEQEK